MSTATKRVLPADVYDALAASAETYGGIGGAKMELWGAPYCMLGYAARLDGSLHGRVTNALYRVGFGIDANDAAVKTINRRLPWRRRALRWRYARVTFAEWCAELGVERGA